MAMGRSRGRGRRRNTRLAPGPVVGSSGPRDRDIRQRSALTSDQTPHLHTDHTPLTCLQSGDCALADCRDAVWRMTCTWTWHLARGRAGTGVPRPTAQNRSPSRKCLRRET
eukprot:5723543-Prymnesium_polylepis.1